MYLVNLTTKWWLKYYSNYVTHNSYGSLSVQIHFSDRKFNFFDRMHCYQIIFVRVYSTYEQSRFGSGIL